MGIYFRDILLIRISRGANNCGQHSLEKNIYFIMRFSPHFQLFYFNDRLEFCEFFEWKIKRINNADLFSQPPLLIFIKGANISGGHCIYIMSEFSFLIELLLCYIRHVLKFALDFALFEKTKESCRSRLQYFTWKYWWWDSQHKILQYTKTWTYILQEHYNPNEHKAVFTTEYTCQLVWGKNMGSGVLH